MNPLRTLLVNFFRMPPAVMLLLIIGLAVIVTRMVIGKPSENEKALDAQKEASKRFYSGFEQKAY